jgi:hypothetical protein
VDAAVAPVDVVQASEVPEDALKSAEPAEAVEGEGVREF